MGAGESSASTLGIREGVAAVVVAGRMIPDAAPSWATPRVENIVGVDPPEEAFVESDLQRPPHRVQVPGGRSPDSTAATKSRVSASEAGIVAR